MNKHSILEVHTEHTNWYSKLDFFKDEIAILENQLEEIAAKNKKPDILAEVEKFQNQFIIQKDNIDRIRHAVNLDEDKVIKELKRNPNNIDKHSIEEDSSIEDSINTFEKNFKELRYDFSTFLAK
jgi:hypothetical protein